MNKTNVLKCHEHADWLDYLNILRMWFLSNISIRNSNDIYVKIQNDL